MDDSAVARREVSHAVALVADVVEAAHGAEALALAKETAFDLVITDLNMPVMGGVELTRMLRGLPGYAKTPIFAVTTESSAEVLTRSKAAGITAWIVKPINPQLLARAVTKAVTKAVG